MDAMVEALVELEDEPLTNNPDAVGELLGAWDTVVETLWIDMMEEGLYRHSSCQSCIHVCNGSYSLVVLVSCES